MSSTRAHSSSRGSRKTFNRDFVQLYLPLQRSKCLRKIRRAALQFRNITEKLSLRPMRMQDLDRILMQED